MTENLSKYRPTLILLGIVILAAILGYVWGSSAVKVADTGLWQLEPSYQGIYVQSVADAYSFDSNDALALERLSYLCQENGGLTSALEQAATRYGADPVKAANLDQLRTFINSGVVAQSEAVRVCSTSAVGGMAAVGRILAPLLLVLMIAGIAAYAYLGLGEGGGFEMPSFGRGAERLDDVEPSSDMDLGFGRPSPPPASEPSPIETESSTARRPSLPSIPGLGRRQREEEPAEPRSAAALGASLSREAEKTNFEAIGQDAPLVQFMTTYLQGDDLYDDSFSIETPSGEFLGETGVGISESLGSTGDAKAVTALEVWLFDKNDIRTVTKVLMSDHAYNDSDIRTRLAPKGEAVLARPGDKVILETATLRVQARIVDLSYKTDTMPPNAVFDRITIELASWRRNGQPNRPNSLPGLSGLPGS